MRVLNIAFKTRARVLSLLLLFFHVVAQLFSLSNNKRRRPTTSSLHVFNSRARAQTQIEELPSRSLSTRARRSHTHWRERRFSLLLASLAECDSFRDRNEHHWLAEARAIASARARAYNQHRGSRLNKWPFFQPMRPAAA